MDTRDNTHYREKHAKGSKPREEIVQALSEAASAAEIGCAKAFVLAKDLNVPAGEVGMGADFLGLRIIKCQLGLFGYRPQKRVVKPADTVRPALREAVQGRLQNGRLPCRAAWDIAKDLHISRMQVASACEAMKVKISPCQLGAF